MRCPYCQTKLKENAVICTTCDMILDAGFLGDDILNEQAEAPNVKKVASGEGLENSFDQDFEASTFVGKSEDATRLQDSPLFELDRTQHAPMPSFGDHEDLGDFGGPDTVFEGGAVSEENPDNDPQKRAEATFRQAQKELNAGEVSRARVLVQVALTLHDDPRFRELLQECDQALP